VDIVAAETSFTSQISQIKRRMAFQAMQRVVLNALLFFLAIGIAYFILNLAGVTNNRIKGAWLALPMAISLSAAIIISLATRSKFLNALIDIDRRLKLQDRVSTAYEYFKLKKKTDFAELLINDAAVKLRQFSRQQLLPFRFSWLHLLAIILLFINILLYSGILFRPDFKSTRRELEKMEAAGRLLKDYMIKRIADQTAPQSKPRSGHAKKLAQISHKLNDRSEPFEQRLGALNSFLQEVEGERTRLAQELAARLDSAAIEQLPVPQTPDLANFSSSQLEKLKGLLSKTLNNRVPESIDQNIESLQELDNLENLLSRIIDDLEADRAQTDDAAQFAGIEGERTPQSTETPENQTDAPGSQYPTGKLSDRDPNSGNRVDHRNFREGPRTAAGLPDGMEPPQGYSNAAGNAKSNQENQASRDLAKTQSPASQDKLVSSPAKTYLIHVRALTDKGEARVKEEDIFRTYRQEVESILQKEDVPVNYREYIKNYFIAIGINTEENAHESK
jgi:hypothetical protein